MQHRLVTIHGPSCSGKSTAGAYLSAMGWAWIEASDYLSRILNEMGFGESDLDKDTLFERYGTRIVAQRIIKDLEPNCDYCVTGLRMPEELHCFREVFSVTAIYVESPVEVRYRRAVVRNRTDIPESLAAFVSHSEWELSLGLNKLRALCDTVLKNEESLDAFKMSLRPLL